MPYLNWKNSALRQDLVREPADKARMELRFGSAERDDLVTALEGIFSGEGGELRLDLPKNWVVFWKMRDGESRLLVAHPEVEEWVATVALEAEHARKSLDGLRGLSVGASLRLGAIHPIGSVSNLELVLTLE